MASDLSFGRVDFDLDVDAELELVFVTPPAVLALFSVFDPAAGLADSRLPSGVGVGVSGVLLTTAPISVQGLVGSVGTVN